MAKSHGKHAAPQKSHPLKVVMGVIAVVALIAASVVAVRCLTGQMQFSVAFLTPLNSPKQAQKQSVDTPKQTTSNDTPEAQSPTTTTAVATVQEEQEEEGEQTPTVEPTTVEVMMVGDVLMHDELVDSGYREDGSYYFGFLFDHITDELATADLKILNQETVMGEPERGYHYYMGGGGPIMNTPTALADTEVDYGFNLILKATNHTLDLHYSGLGHELDYWKSAHPEIPVVGVDNPNTAKADDSQDYVDNVYVGEYNGMKIAILNYTGGTNEVVDGMEYQWLSFMTEDKIRSDVDKARAAGAEMIIACPHWGTEYYTDPSYSEQESFFGQLFCDLGVDVVFGCHPHVLQPVRVLVNEQGHKTVIYYSMGDFVCAGGMRTDALIGGVARVTLERSANGTCQVSSASLDPTVICYTVGPHMSAYPLQEWTYELAAEGARPDLTPDYAYAFLSEVFGDTFNSETGVVTIDV